MMLSNDNQTHSNYQLYCVEHDKFCNDKNSIKNGWYSSLPTDFIKKHEICLEKCKCNQFIGHYCNKHKWIAWSQLVKAWLNKLNSDEDKIIFLEYFWKNLITPTQQDFQEFNPKVAKWGYDVLRPENYNANNFERYTLRKWKKDFLIKEIQNLENYWIRIYKKEISIKQQEKRNVYFAFKNDQQKQLNYLNNELYETKQKLKTLLDNNWPNSVCEILQNWINLLLKQLAKIKNVEFKPQHYNWKWQTAKCCCSSIVNDICNKCKWANFTTTKNEQLNQKISNDKKIDILENSWKTLIEPTFKDIQSLENKNEVYDIFNANNYTSKDFNRYIFRTWKSDFIVNKIKNFKKEDCKQYYQSKLLEQQYRVWKNPQRTNDLKQRIDFLNHELYVAKRDLMLRRKTHWPRFICELLQKQVTYLEKKKKELTNNIHKQSSLNHENNHTSKSVNKEEINM